MTKEILVRAMLEDDEEDGFKKTLRDFSEDRMPRFLEALIGEAWDEKFTEAYNPDQPRDDKGRFGAGGGGAGSSPSSMPRALPGDDPRIPPAGTMIEKKWGGKSHSVMIHADGFEWDGDPTGKHYASLTELAKKITGKASISGTKFFGLDKMPEVSKPDAKDLLDPDKVWARIDALSDRHGVAVSAVGDVPLASRLGVHAALANLPPGMQSVLRQLGVIVSVVSTDSEPAPDFEVGGVKFKEGGHASYDDGKLVVRAHPFPGTKDLDVLNDDGSTRSTEKIPLSDHDRAYYSDYRYSSAMSITSHEAGHFAAKAVAGMAEIASVEYDRLGLAASNLNKERKEIEREKAEREGHPNWSGNLEPGEDAKYDAIIKKRDEVFAAKEKLEPVSRLMYDFSQATMKEGGVTPYSDAYVKDPVRGQWQSAWILPDHETPSGVNPTMTRKAVAQIASFANENFSEMTSILYGGGRSRAEAENGLRGAYPKTLKTYKALAELLPARVKVPRMERL